MTAESDARTKLWAGRICLLAGLIVGPALLLGFAMLTWNQHPIIYNLIDAYGMETVAKAATLIPLSLMVIGQCGYWISVGGPSNA